MQDNGRSWSWCASSTIHKEPPTCLPTYLANCKPYGSLGRPKSIHKVFQRRLATGPFSSDGTAGHLATDCHHFQLRQSPWLQQVGDRRCQVGKVYLFLYQEPFEIPSAIMFRGNAEATPVRHGGEDIQHAGIKCIRAILQCTEVAAMPLMLISFPMLQNTKTCGTMLCNNTFRLPRRPRSEGYICDVMWFSQASFE